MAELVMMCGLPGCGKSTYAKKTGYVVCSSDEIREVFGISDNQKVFEELHKRIRSALNDGKSVVYDATNLSRKRRIGFLQQVKQWKISDLKTRVVFFAVPLSICKKQNLMRDAVVPNSVYDKFIRQIQIPDIEEGWDEVEIIHDFRAFDKSVRIEELDAFSQDNSHHVMTLGEHLKAAEAYAIRHGFSQEVCEAAKYHDIGKFLTKKFEDSRGNPSEEAHYYGHEHASAYIYYTEISPDIDVARIIEWHMRPHLWEKENGEKIRERDRLYLEKLDIYDEVVQMYEADVKAHGVKKEKEKLER